MTLFEILVLAFYMLSAFGYMVNALGVYEEDSIWIRVLIVLYALTFGMLYFPIVFSFDIYNKLHE